MHPEFQAYQHALSVWRNFHATSKCLMLDEESMSDTDVADSLQGRVLRLLPPVERRPVAFGAFIRFAKDWSPIRQSIFMGEFLPGPCTVERRLLEAAAKGAIPPQPRRIPVTVEEFPSRVWKRAMASGSAERMVGAAYHAFQSIVRLLEHHGDEESLEDIVPFHLSWGDLPPLIDLLALPPVHTKQLKDCIFERIDEAIRSGRFQPTSKDMSSIKAWSFADHEEGVSLLHELVSELRETSVKRIANGTLSYPYDTRRLGRLMFRVGLRRHAYSCAKALGYSPWESGWQFQIVSAGFHARIRKIILRRGVDGDRWMKEPTLACSAMTIPLWLSDGVERVAELTALFNQAGDCPWIFPHLQAIYQWHLALAGKTAVLGGIEQLAPELSLGLSAASHGI
jgi:hypothetical protein